MSDSVYQLGNVLHEDSVAFVTVPNGKAWAVAFSHQRLHSESVPCLSLSVFLRDTQLTASL